MSYAECRKQSLNAECHYAECRHAKCRGPLHCSNNFWTPFLTVVSFFFFGWKNLFLRKLFVKKCVLYNSKTWQCLYSFPFAKFATKNSLIKASEVTVLLILPWLPWVKELKESKTYLYNPRQEMRHCWWYSCFCCSFHGQKIANVNTNLKCLFS